MQGNICPLLLLLVKQTWKLRLLASLILSGRARLETAPLEEGEGARGEEEKELRRDDDGRPDFSDI